jgi:hypothetical protein
MSYSPPTETFIPATSVIEQNEKKKFRTPVSVLPLLVACVRTAEDAGRRQNRSQLKFKPVVPTSPGFLQSYNYKLYCLSGWTNAYSWNRL